MNQVAREAGFNKERGERETITKTLGLEEQAYDAIHFGSSTRPNDAILMRIPVHITYILMHVHTI
jgi:hypothetical protein